MLDEHEFDAYCRRLRLDQQARLAVENIRKSAPSRLAQSASKNVASIFPSRKMGLSIQAESHTVELAACHEWEHDQNVLEFWDQPPRIKIDYLRNGRRLSHLITPDYFLLEKDWVGWVECKTEDWLQKSLASGKSLYVKDDHGRWRFPPGEEFARSLGLDFKVRSSAETDWIYSRNIRMLCDYLRADAPIPTEAELKILQEKMGTQPWWILRDLVLDDPPVSAGVVLKEIAEGNLYIDLHSELLAEPETVHVFLDEKSAQAHRCYLDAMISDQGHGSGLIELQAGLKMLWDGNLWTVGNLGRQVVTLVSELRECLSVSRSDLVLMIRDGSITASEPPDSDLHDRREALVRRAGPNDMAVAQERYCTLFPEYGAAAKTYSSRSERSWRAAFRHAEATLGNGFLGLLPRIHDRGNRTRKIDEPVIALMRELIKDKLLNSRRSSVRLAYGELRLRCKEQGLLPPSEKTFRAERKRQIRRSEDVRLREGDKAAYAQSDFLWSLERTAPRHGDRPFEVGHIDHTELDIQLMGRRFKDFKLRAWLTLLVDAYTRRVLGFYLSFEKPSYRSCMCVIRDCVYRGNIVPDTLVVDKSAEFRSRYFTQLCMWLHCEIKIRPTAQ